MIISNSFCILETPKIVVVCIGFPHSKPNPIGEVLARHMGNIQDALSDIRNAIWQLVDKRDERRDAFAKGIKLAMNTTLGHDAKEVHEVLSKHGVSSRLAEQAVELAGPQTPFSVFAIVDALTRLAGRYENAGDRLVLDQKAAALLSLAA